MISIPENVMKIADVLDNKKALDIVILKVDDMTIISDYFVVAGANSTTHAQTLSDEVQLKMADAGEKPVRVEGERQGRWIVIDFGGVLVHVFHKEERDFYQLERLWKVADNYYDYSSEKLKESEGGYAAPPS